MTESNVVFLPSAEGVEDPLTEVLRAGARQLVRHAVEAEVAVLLAAYADHRTETGRRRLVRHGLRDRGEGFRHHAHARLHAAPQPLHIHDDVPVSRVWDRKPYWRPRSSASDEPVLPSRPVVCQVPAVHQPHVRRIPGQSNFNDIAGPQIAEVIVVEAQVSLSSSPFGVRVALSHLPGRFR